ncbi:hypothetical protein EIN_484850 [Entamoeba invadens IP1]|uniref:Ribosomal protein eL8/eL30/eS12/Gadd45 domain-containing protein n=1 Tax=Entamoeba invadens IP1 TaxID=370355 RepID=A0A0A1UAC9_ENTIV|nr:hypothetical protein EIN_484850 [Entamoeba invadens IP1]ELP89143.1 hypothetical protein EIN_484850 [Entamoeba invadens IP1]|eukprot:XP_004255914.1 hypothetical protein EIN_484850 [Entamoeba invadens IP1]
MSSSDDSSSESHPVTHLVPIAKPLADEKMQQKLKKLLKEAIDDKCLKRGIKDTMKTATTCKDGEKLSKSLCIIAGDVTPIDIITHIPSYMKSVGVAYIYVDSRKTLGEMSGSEHLTTCALVFPTKDNSCYKACQKIVKELKKD